MSLLAILGFAATVSFMIGVTEAQAFCMKVRIGQEASGKQIVKKTGQMPIRQCKN